MLQISAGIVFTSGAFAFSIKRFGVLPESTLLDADFSMRSEQHSIACISGGHYAVKHIYSCFNSFQQICRISNTHKVTGFFSRHFWCDMMGYIIHFFLCFTYTQTANSIAVKTYLNNLMHGLFTQVKLMTSLYDAKKSLFFKHIRFIQAGFFATPCPFCG